MSIFQSIILGIVQGLTEFIPISSSGHLVIIREMLTWEDPGILYDVILHIGTLAAVIAYFRRDLAEFFTSLIRKNENTAKWRNIAWYIVIATLPAAIIGFFAGGFIEENIRDITSTSLLMVAMGVVMLLAEYRVKVVDTRTLKTTSSMTAKDALAIGLAQIFALLPGISRSGMTISAGITRNMSRAESTRFSFLLSIPVIAGAGLKGLFELADHGPNGTSAAALLIGFVMAGVVGYISIAFLVRYLKTNTLHVFAYYVIGVGALLFLITQFTS
jgi:undecaprenyl-diphosphatase